MSGAEEADRTTRGELRRAEVYRRWVARNEGAIESAYNDEGDGRLPLTFALRAWMLYEAGRPIAATHHGEVRRGAELIATAAVATVAVIYSGTIDALAILHQASGRDVKWPRIEQARRLADASLIAVEGDSEASETDRAVARLVAIATRIHEATLRCAFASSYGVSIAHEGALRRLAEDFVRTAHVALGEGLSRAVSTAFPFWSLPTAHAWRSPAPRGRASDGAPRLLDGTLVDHWVGLALGLDLDYERIADATDAVIARVRRRVRPKRGSALARRLALAERLSRAFRVLDVDDHLDALGIRFAAVQDMAPAALFEANTAMLPHPKPRGGWSDSQWESADAAFNAIAIPILREHLPEVAAALAVHAEWIARRDAEKREAEAERARKAAEAEARAASHEAVKPDLSVYELPADALGVIPVDVGTPSETRAVA